jgi:hypothetical protein
MSFAVGQATLAAAVANAGTVVVPYPAGFAQANFTGINAAANTGRVIINGNDSYPEAAAGVRVNFTFNGGDVTITNNTGVSWPAGSTVRYQLGIAGNDRPGFQASPAITTLTDSTGGTASDTLAAIGGTYSQSEVRNMGASLAAKINAILLVLKREGITL